MWASILHIRPLSTGGEIGPFFTDVLSTMLAENAIGLIFKIHGLGVGVFMVQAQQGRGIPGPAIFDWARLSSSSADAFQFLARSFSQPDQGRLFLFIFFIFFLGKFILNKG